MPSAPDPEMVEVLRLQLSRAVSEQDVRAGRAAMLRDVPPVVLLGGGIGAFMFVLGQWELGLMYVAVLVPTYLSNVYERYRLLRVRLATPVPTDILAAAVRDHRPCPDCHAIVPIARTWCPICRHSFINGRLIGLAIAASLGILAYFLARP